MSQAFTRISLDHFSGFIAQHISLSTPQINRFLCLGNPTVRKDEPADAMVRDLGFNMLFLACGDGVEI